MIESGCCVGLTALTGKSQHAPASRAVVFEPATVLKIRSPAKLNLVLEVLGERADGYHEVRTVMQSIDLCDEISIEGHSLAGHLELHTNVMSCPVDEKNLVWQAIHWLREATGLEEGFVITIDKSIPVSAGLGGGSSNAGAVLAALVARYKLNVGHGVLRQTASRIGSDVPFFLVGGTSHATGRGEIVAEAPPDWPTRTRRYDEALAALEHDDADRAAECATRLTTDFPHDAAAAALLKRAQQAREREKTDDPSDTSVWHLPGK